MDETNTFSFDRFFKIPETEMLHASLPYVSNQMRKPLALYIKSAELRHILSDFDGEEMLSACGLEDNPPDPEAMLKAMKLAGGKNAGPQIDQLLQMMNLIKTYQKMTEMMQNNPEIMTFLNNMMSQPQSSGPNYGEKAGFADRMAHTEKAPASKGMDPADMMSLLTQMLKNN